ncbi:hypothetical protein [Actinoplanes sp. M2I2]|uniref:hypothetical protein n=1 Tax=Actinoplanes sp. M2I2 TaxID=1734444 RepID=UPI0020210D6A|nr:hypothetical protein [Actinoplanes sp. M2I2]
MSEPTADEVLRGVTALLPFVRRWDLALNPEDVEELAYAVLLHVRSELSLEEVFAAVEQQIDEHERRMRRLHDAMERDNAEEPTSSPQP